MKLTDKRKAPNGAALKAHRPSTEVPILTLDFRFWRKRPMTDAQARKVMMDLSEFARRGDLGLRRPLRTEGDETVIQSSRSAMADGGDDTDCVVVSVEYRDCTDDQGNQHHCRCELYKCSNGSTKWLCTPID